MSAIKTAFNKDPPTHIFFADAGSSPDCTWNGEPSIRFICCIRGDADHYCMTRDGVSLIHLNPGHALLAAPGHPIRSGPSHAVMANIIITPELSLLRYRDRSRTLHPSTVCTADEAPIFYHLGHALCAALKTQINKPVIDNLTQSLWHLARTCTRHNHANTHKRPVDSFAAACQIINHDLESDLGRDQIARSINIHPNHLSRLFRERAGMSFRRYLGERRLERAALLLRNGNMSIAAVSRASGFSSPSVFNQACRRLRNCTPSQLS